MKILILLLIISSNIYSKTYSCKKDKHSCYSGKLGFNIPKPVILKEHVGKYVIFNADAKYQHDWETNMQINKLFGFTDFGAILPHENTAMFGFRHLVTKDHYDLIEILGYIHREDIVLPDGRNFYHAHVGLVRVEDKNLFNIYVSSDNYIFSINNESFLITKRLDDGKILGREITPWFGGQKKSPKTFSFEMDTFKTKSIIFKNKINVSFMSEDKCAEQDANSLLVDSSSNIYEKFKAYCRGTVTHGYKGCNNQIGPTSTSLNSKPVYKFELTCN
jgi:hypothetical protein